LAAVTDFISVPFYDLFHENGHVPKIRRNLFPLLGGVRRSILEVGAGTGRRASRLAPRLRPPGQPAWRRPDLAVSG